MSLPITTDRRYAEWTPGYAGAPVLWGAYYLVSALCLIYALAMTYIVRFAGALCFPLQLAGPQAVRLAMPGLRRRVAPLRDLPSPVPQYAVRFTLRREVTYADDEGLASFVGGWLVVQAAGCVFSFRASDVAVSRSDLSVQFRGPAGYHRLRFIFSECGFREAWEDWRTTTSLVEGAPVFPPVQPLDNRKGWIHTGVATILGVAASAIPFHSSLAGAWLVGIAVTLLSSMAYFRRKAVVAHLRIAAGKPPRRSARTILGANIHLERLGEAYAADRRRRRRRRGLVRLNTD